MLDLKGHFASCVNHAYTATPELSVSCRWISGPHSGIAVAMQQWMSHVSSHLRGVGHRFADGSSSVNSANPGRSAQIKSRRGGI